MLVTDGVDDAVLDALRKAVEKEGARARDRGAEDRRRDHRQGQEAAGGSGAVGRALGVLRCGRGAAVGRGRRAAGEGSRRDRLAARCLRPSQGDRLCRCGRADVRQGGHRARCRRRRGRSRRRRAGIHQGRQAASHLGARADLAQSGVEFPPGLTHNSAHARERVRSNGIVRG